MRIVSIEPNVTPERASNGIITSHLPQQTNTSNHHNQQRITTYFSTSTHHLDQFPHEQNEPNTQSNELTSSINLLSPPNYHKILNSCSFSNARSRGLQSRITQFFDSNSSSSLINSTHHSTNPPTPSIMSSANMYIQNVGGMRTKSCQIYRNSSSSDYNIIALTETWLNSGHSSSEFFDNTYVVFRKDRCETDSTLKEEAAF